MNADMHHTSSDLSNFSLGDCEQLYIAAFYAEIVAFPDEISPNHVPIPTCPAVVAGGSGIRESITTVTPLSHPRTLRKRTQSSDLRADFLSDEAPVVKLPKRRMPPTVESLRRPSGIQARAMYRLAKFTGVAARIFHRRHGLGHH